MTIYFPDYDPIYSASKRSEPLTKKSKFGDGYEQRVNFGFNQNPKEWILSFNVSEEDADVIESFLNARSLDSQPFDWTPPDSSTSLRWICSSWTRELFDFQRSKIDATFKQVFEPPSPLIYGYAQGVNKLIQITYTPGAATLPGLAPGSNLQITASYTPGAAVGAFLFNIAITYTPGMATGGGGLATGESSAFWHYWKYSETDEQIFLYEDEPAAQVTGDGAAYWSDWRPFDDEVFFYGEEVAASGDMPVYWNRWQSWTEDPPLIFEESP